MTGESEAGARLEGDQAAQVDLVVGERVEQSVVVRSVEQSSAGGTGPVEEPPVLGGVGKEGLDRGG